MVSLTKEKAQGFYAVHCERPFFDSLTDFMSSGPCVVMILEGDGAILKWRTIMGATDPAKADPGTIRKDFASNVEQNCVHGSDAPETAAQETEVFFQRPGDPCLLSDWKPLQSIVSASIFSGNIDRKGGKYARPG